MNTAAGLIRVTVAARPEIWFCLDPEGDDQQSNWMLEHGWIDPPHVRLLLDSLAPGARVIDGDCGVGVFALAAAATGAEVFALASCAEHVALVQAAARRNGFESLHVELASRARPRDWEQVDATNAVAQGSAPTMVFSSLPQAGEPYLIDPLRERTLVRITEGEQPPHAHCHYAVLAQVPDDWRIEPPLGPDQVLARLIDEAASPDPTCRAHAARRLASLADPFADAARNALALDLDPQVRLLAGSSTGVPTTERRPSPGETVVLASSLTLMRDGETVVRDCDLHLRHGQYVGILGDDPALLEAIGGTLAPSSGTLEVLVQTTLATGLEQAFEPGLSVAQNLELLAVFLGGNVTAVDRRMAALARRGGFAHALGTRVGDVDAQTITRVLLSAALECAPGPLLLLAGFGEIDDPQLRRWATHRVHERLRAGATIMQYVQRPQELLTRPDRLLWMQYDGHTESVAAAWEHSALAVAG